MYSRNWTSLCHAFSNVALVWLIFRLEIIEQVNDAPRMYILAVAEVVRRRSFSSQFQKVRNSNVLK